jgi:ketosteroid isomerase-like protein
VGVTSSDSQSPQDVEELVRSGIAPGPGSVFDGQQWIEEISAVLEGNTDSDFLTVLSSESDTREFHGIDGFREAISDWISPYAEFRLVIDDVMAKDDKLVFLATQIATTRHGGVEMETESASVWWVRDDRIAQIVFYLDRQSALKAAGIDPDRPAGE